MANFTLLDGGMGRELKRVGAPFRQPEWSALALIEAPEAVLAVHRAYVSAGADIVTTNSYALVPFHIGEERFRDQARSLANLAGQLAREAANDRAGVRVAASLPPLFGSYRPDLFDPARASQLLMPLVEGLRPHADLWLAETLSSCQEAQVVVEGIGDDPRPLWLSFTLDDEGDGPGDQALLRSGEPVADAARLAAESGAKAVLFNCSQPEVMARAIDAARGVLNGAGLAIGVYANAFPPQRKDATANETVLPLRDDLDPQGYLLWVQSWLDRGASIVGGCCGIGPEHIIEIAQYRASIPVGEAGDA